MIFKSKYNPLSQKIQNVFFKVFPGKTFSCGNVEQIDQPVPVSVQIHEVYGEYPSGNEADPPGDEANTPGDKVDPAIDEVDIPGDEANPPEDEADTPGDEADPPVDEADTPVDEAGR